MKNDIEGKRSVLKDLMALAKSMKADSMRQKYAPPKKDDPTAEPEGTLEIEVEPGEDTEMEAATPEEGASDEGGDPKVQELLKQLQADPEALKKLLGK